MATRSEKAENSAKRALREAKKKGAATTATFAIGNGEHHAARVEYSPETETYTVHLLSDYLTPTEISGVSYPEALSHMASFL